MGQGMNLAGRRKDGSCLTVEVGLNPVEGEEGPFVLATVVDTSERTKAEEREKLFTRELHHRAQNLLALIDVVVKRSLSGERSLDEAREVLAGRIKALSNSFAILRGTPEASKLRLIAENELRPFLDRVSIISEDIALSPQAAQDFGLILHELTTNAVKYGSLSVPSGTVHIKAAIEGPSDDPRFFLDWQEADGPPAPASKRRGFGSVVLERTPKSFCDFIQSEFLARGFHYRLEGKLCYVQP
jgi:two-component sensor histidine kinase